MKNPDNHIGTGAEIPLMPEITKDVVAEAAPDALSIVIDAVNSSVGGLIITDLDGKIRFANTAFCKMFEYSPSQVIGKQAMDLFAGKEIRNFADLITIIDISKDDTEENRHCMSGIATVTGSPGS